MGEATAKRAGYIFDAGPDELTDTLLKNANTAFVERYLAAQARSRPLLNDLERAGFKVNKPSDLIAAGQLALPAFDILKEWLVRPDSPADGTEILQVLAQPWAREHTFDFLVSAYRSVGLSAAEEMKQTQGSIGAVLVDLAGEEDFPLLLELARHSEYGSGRSMMLYSIGRFRKHKDELVPVLLDALSASLWEVGGAIHALGELRATEIREQVSNVDTQESDWLAGEKKKTLKKFDTAEAREAQREVRSESARRGT